MKDVAFGRTQLPRRQAEALRRAIRLEWITIGFLAFAVILVGLVLGNSQAMKVAWAEDLLSLLPPIAFLIYNGARPHPVIDEVEDMVVVPVPALPAEVVPFSRGHEDAPS